MAWFRWLVDDTSFMPRWACGHWDDALVNVNIAANAAISLAYAAIFFQAWWFWRVVRDRLLMTWVILLIGGFILACGSTHLADVLVFWWAPYRLFTALDLVTAGLSVAAAVALPAVLRYLAAMPSAAQLAVALADREASLVEARDRTVEMERLRVDVENTNRFLRTKLEILQDRLVCETDHAARMADIDDVRAMLDAVPGEGQVG